MIRAVSLCPEHDLRHVLKQEPILAAHMDTHYQIYGANSDLWLQYSDDAVPAAAIMASAGGCYRVIASPAAGLDELDLFLLTSDVRSISSTPSFCERFRHLGAYISAPTMVYHGAPLHRQNCIITETPPFREVYDLLAQTNEWFAASSPWDTWYTYHSHMVRHGIGRICGIYVQGRLASTGGIIATNKQYALIGSIATYPDFRSRGFAASIVRHLCDAAIAQNKTPCLSCGEEELEGFYAALGFERHGYWAEVERHP